jgi:iron complex transport system substrate-binding protein
MKTSLRSLVYLLLLGVLTFTLTQACVNNINQHVVASKQLIKDCRVVQHMMGNTCIPLNPQRVVTLSSTILDNTLALGIKPVASVSFSKIINAQTYLQDKVNEIEFIGLEGTANIEKIALMQPDLILADNRSQEIYKYLSYIAPTVLMQVFKPRVPWKQQLEDLAKVLDKEEIGKQLMDAYWQRIEELKQTLGIGTTFPKENRRHQIQVSVATVESMIGIYAYGEKHPVGIVINDIGLQRPPAQRGDFYYIDNISKERLSDIDGDVLFFLFWPEDSTKEVLEKLQQDPLWQKLKVVQQNRVYLVDATHWHSRGILAMNAVIDDLFKYLVNGA